MTNKRVKNPWLLMISTYYGPFIYGMLTNWGVYGFSVFFYTILFRLFSQEISRLYASLGSVVLWLMPILYLLISILAFIPIRKLKGLRAGYVVGFLIIVILLFSAGF